MALLSSTPKSTNAARCLAGAGAPLAAGLVVTLPPAQFVPLLLYAAIAVAVGIEGRIAYYLLPLTVPFGSWFPLPGAGVPVTPSDVVVAALLLTWLVRQSPPRTLAVTWRPWLVALALLLLAMAISMFDALSIAASVPEIAKWLEVLVVAALAPVFLRSERDVWTVVAIAVVGATTEATIGLGQFLLHAGPKAFDIHGRFLRAYGTFGQPNPLAGYLNMVLPIAMACACWRRAPWLWLAVLVIAAGSAATLSRAGWVAGGLAVLVIALYYFRWVRPWVILGGLGGLLFVLLTVMGAIPVQPLARVATSFGLTGINFAHHTHANFSEVERAAHWLAGLRMFEAHPILGVGIGNYSTAYPAYHVAHFLAPLGHAHNYFINIAAEAGIFGLAAYTLFVMTGFASTISIARFSSRGGLPAALSIGLVGMWASSTFHNLFDVLYVHELPVLIGLLMGAMFALEANGRNYDSASPRPVLEPLR